MHILVSNDDGYSAKGILALATELAKKHRVTIFAPETEQSGVGHGFTFLNSLMSRRVDKELNLDNIRAYAVNGTPVDCVKLGLFLLGDDRPDFVVSGINHGANLGTDVMYSGTASAASEGCLTGISSLAVSSTGYDNMSYFDTASVYASKVVDFMSSSNLPTEVMLNLNVPNVTAEDVKGLKVAPMAIRNYTTSYDTRTNPRGMKYHWLNDMVGIDHGKDTDEAWVARGYASLTPLQLDRTNYDFLANIKKIDFDS